MLEQADREPAAWSENIDDVSSNHTLVSGVLSGFSITIVVLIISLNLREIVDLSNDLLPAISLGQFTLAFFGYVITGVLYSITVERKGELRFFIFSISSVTYYFSAILGFSAILPLIRFIQLHYLLLAVYIIVVGMFFGGFFAASLSLYDLLLIKKSDIFITLFGSIIFGLLLYLIPLNTYLRLNILMISCSLLIVFLFCVASFAFYFDIFKKTYTQILISIISFFLSTSILSYIIFFIIMVEV